MKLYDNETQDLAHAVQSVLEGKNPVKEAKKYPHDMFHPKTGEKVVANNEEEHNALSKKGYTHEAPKENVAGPADLDNKENQKKVKAAHPVDVKEDIDVAHEEALEMNESLEETVAEAKTDEQSDKQKKYKAFFDKALKKFGVDSPAELEGDKKKEFFDYVDANYEAENEED